MIRRTHVDTLFGRPLLKLPEIKNETVVLNFTDFERCIYNIVRARFIARINKYSRKGELDKQYRNVFVMLLRLRQLTGHVLMIQETLEDLLTYEDVEKLMMRTKSEVEAGGNKVKMLTELRNVLRLQTTRHPIETTQQVSEAGAATNLPTSAETEVDDRYGNTFKLRKVLKALRTSEKWEQLKERSLCHKCADPSDDPWVTSCLHVYCRECLTSLLWEAKKQGQDRGVCMECDNEFETSEPCEGLNELGYGVETEATQGSTLGSLQDRSGKRRSSSKETESNLDWINLPGDLLPSTKTVAAKLQIQDWLGKSPSNKIIVYTQFLDMIRILGKICDIEGWEFVQYHGKMSFEARDKAIAEFKEGSKRILLATLKTGGLGLNLTAASKVILLDLWWNEGGKNNTGFDTID